MKIVEHFGPKVAKAKLSKEDTQALFDICQTTTEPFNHESVGIIREEIRVTTELMQNKVYHVLLNYVHEYLRNIDSGYWSNIIQDLSDSNFLELQEAWYNKQTALEFNPLHNHRDSADLVCVTYPKIELDNSFDQYYITNTRGKQTGQIHFAYGTNLANDFGKSLITVQPEEGDILVFPSTLDHYTSPVLGNSVRYSLSCNFKFTNLARRLLSKTRIK